MKARSPEFDLGRPAADLLTLDHYLRLRSDITDRGYGDEIEWAQSVQPVSDAMSFFCEFAWVVLNSGMKNTIAHQIWRKVRPIVLNGHSAHLVFGHKGKADAINYVWANKDRLFAEYQSAIDKIAYLRSLPWIGNITCWHLAKNYGFDVAKPDRHLVRIARAQGEGVQELCQRLSRLTGDRIATVDLVIWRAASLGLV